MQSIESWKMNAVDCLSQSIFQLFRAVYYSNASFSARFLPRNSGDSRNSWISRLKRVISSVPSSNAAAYPRFRGRQGVKGEQAIPYQPCIRMQPSWRSEVLAAISLAFAGCCKYPQSRATLVEVQRIDQHGKPLAIMQISTHWRKCAPNGDRIHWDHGIRKTIYQRRGGELNVLWNYFLVSSQYVFYVFGGEKRNLAFLL